MSVLIVERIVERIAIVSSLRGITLMISMMLISAQLLAQPRRKEHVVEHPTFYRTVQVDGLSIFYREAGPKSAPTILLLLHQGVFRDRSHRGSEENRCTNSDLAWR